MAISKDKKHAIVAIVFVGFSKLTVKDSSRVRKELAQGGVRYFVAKKTLLRLALKQQGYEGQAPELPGEVAVAWTKDDVTAPARNIYDHGKKLKGALTLLGGVFENAFADAQKMIGIATIPPIPVLRGMFVNVINSPIQGLVMALDQISKKKA